MLARTVAIAALVALAGAGPGAQPPGQAAPTPAAQARSPRNASYAISARLDPASRTLQGDELLTWRNPSAAPATSLRFHLYYNAWRNTASTWMRERRLAGNTEPAERPERDWGWIDLTSIRLIGAGGTPTDLTSRLRFVAPDDGNVDDRTVAEIPLDEPVAPGQTINVQIAWSSRVPRTFARTGTIGNYYFVAQWFPKIGVLENGGWNCHQFHAATEFFSDFGAYDVRLTVPRGWIVGATGQERSRRDEADGTTTHQYLRRGRTRLRVDDESRLCRADRDVRAPATALGGDAAPAPARTPRSGRAPFRRDPRRASLLRRVVRRLSLRLHHGDRSGVAERCRRHGYPTLFTAGTRWLAPRGVTTPEGVTVHEAGHQFWYGIVATNEFERAWMDEGFNTFSTARTIEQVFEPNYLSKRYFGDFIPWVFRDIQLTRAVDGNRLNGYRMAARSDAQDTPTWRYWPGTAGAITYNKTALWLNTLERMLGWDTLQKILNVYFTRWAFKHPRPEDFFAVASEISGRDLTWFFDQVYRSSNAFDYGVDTFTSERDATRGYTGEASQRRFASTEATSGTYRTTVVARRYGEGLFPVDVRVVFENGEDVRWQWDGRDRWKLFEIDKPVRARSVQIDPERVLLLDVNYTNNSASLTADTGRAAARKWSLAWLIWLQDHLLTYGFFV